jgi:hypothetical protein
MIPDKLPVLISVHWFISGELREMKPIFCLITIRIYKIRSTVETGMTTCPEDRMKLPAVSNPIFYSGGSGFDFSQRFLTVFPSLYLK